MASTPAIHINYILTDEIFICYNHIIKTYMFVIHISIEQGGNADEKKAEAGGIRFSFGE